MADLQMGLFASTTPDTPIQPAETRSFDEAAAHPPAPEDAEARKQAIDIERSILVQAPAGAGKTNLLTQRYLALLSEVEEPEQILAITFTKAATAEMRARIVGALEAAQRHPQPDTQDETSVLAHKALRHAEQRNWRLLEQTHRLDVQTIDSLCLRLAHSQPLLSRFGGALAPAENADTLYEQAARRTMAQLGRGHDSDLEEALELLLLLRDNNLHECERLLATLLRGRDAWLGVLPLGPAEDVNWDEVRERLQQPFQNSNRQTLEALAESFAHTPGLAHELVVMAGYAADNLEDSCEHRAALLAIRELPDLAQCSREQWLAIAWLLLTGDHAWRRQWTVNMGFPAAGKNPGKELREQHKQRIEECALSLQHNDSENPLLQPLLCQLRSLPATAYTTDQWQTLLAVFRVLRRAVAELRIIFAEANMVDFTEIAQAAEQVLKDESSMRGLLESERKQHILIDEFQDTSRAQYRLVAELLREWRHGDGRTVFLVGDPLQSIYSFRQAEVALFHETREHGLPCGEDRRHPCHTLQLTHNFRSHASLVEALNQRLARMFPPAPAKGGFSDTFVAAHAWPLQGFEDALEVHPIFVEKQRNEYAREGDADEDFAEDQAVNDASNRKSRREETEAVIRVLQQEQPRVEAALAAGASEYQVAVLVRSRPHLAEILPALRAASIPFRAVELEPLADQPEVHDMLMLLRALLHPADRVAWLSVLRAPWCALLMPDLHMLAGNDDVKLRRATIAELIETRSALLSEDGQQRVLRTGSVLATAQRDRLAGGSDLALAAWLEQTWMALGGSACVDANARENIEAFLRLLDTLAPSGMEVLRGDFALRLARLCAAPDATVSDRFGVQVMTMHKAKGLGFEVVLLPGLDRVTMSDPRALLAMLQRAQPGQKGESELLLAPIGSREEATSDPTYAWVMQQKATRDAEERRRLFYVACTRARKRLHLFALVQHSKGEIAVPRGTSLLAAAWPALGEEILEQWPRTRLQAHAPSRSWTRRNLSRLHPLLGCPSPQVLPTTRRCLHPPAQPQSRRKVCIAFPQTGRHAPPQPMSHGTAPPQTLRRNCSAAARARSPHARGAMPCMRCLSA
ncbi:exodeoxyribonuclease V subunit beta [Acidipila sp. EB88]|uniref:UvrD-helicase domain-containing protein n=1 Tax=Acidipila sp. EB88 TaxID=2305226 RepID=UPI000F5E33CD|nr:UvrD-helicase domain-containing protein [Acidipila sp. EB88]RRA47238.1 hypothetical protein D1Y84_01970 [Acidipila sp. EB88]